MKKVFHRDGERKTTSLLIIEEEIMEEERGNQFPSVM